MSDYQIERVSNATYLDAAGVVQQGIAVRVRLNQYDEIRTINAPDDNPATIKAEIDRMMDRRAALAELGADNVAD